MKPAMLFKNLYFDRWWPVSWVLVSSLPGVFSSFVTGSRSGIILCLRCINVNGLMLTCIIYSFVAVELVISACGKFVSFLLGTVVFTLHLYHFLWRYLLCCSNSDGRRGVGCE